MRRGLIWRGEQKERAADNGRFRRGDASEEGDRERHAGHARLENLALVHVAAKEMRLKLALEREFLRIDEPHHDDHSDEAEGGDGRKRGGERGIGNPGERPDHHVLRVSGDRRDAAAIGGGRDRDEIGQRIAVERADHLQHDRRHDETDRVIDQKGRQHARQHRHGDEQHERRAGVVDGDPAKRSERAGDLEMRDHDHHAEEKRDGVEIDRAESVLEAQRAKRDHRRAAEEGDPSAIKTQTRNPPDRDAHIGQDEDDERRHALAFGSHARGAPSTASASASRAVAHSSRVSGMRAKKTMNAMAAAAPRARNDTA